MDELTQETNILHISVCDSIFVSDNIVIEITILILAIVNGLSFNKKEIANLREALRASIGDSADEFAENDLNEFGASMLEATATILKARYLQKSHHLKSINK